MRVCIAKSHTCGHTTQFYIAWYMIYIFVCFFIFSPVAIAIDEPIKCAGRVFGIDRDWLQSQQIMSPLSVLYRVYNTVKLRAVVHLHVLLFWGEKFRYSLNENSPSKMYKGKNVLEILFTLKRDKKKREKTRLRVIGCYWYLDRAYTHTHQPIFLFISSPSPVPFIFSFFFLLWSGEKTHIGNEKEKCSTGDLLLLSFSRLLPQMTEFVATILSYCQLFFISSLFLVGGGL